MIQDLYFNEENDYSEEIQFEPEEKKLVVMRPMRKKLDIFIIQLPIYHILE